MPVFSNSTTDYGIDVTTFAAQSMGLDPYFPIIQGPRVVVEQFARNLLTPTSFYDDQPGIGTDLSEQINGVMAANPQAAAAAFQRRIEDEATKDERIYDCAAAVTIDTSTGAVQADIRLTLIQGQTFQLVLTISQLAANYSILKQVN